MAIGISGSNGGISLIYRKILIKDLNTEVTRIENKTENLKNQLNVSQRST